MKKILLLYNGYFDELGSSRPPLGTGYLSQALQDAGIVHDVIDMKLGYSEKDVLKKIAQKDYDCIGLTVYTLGHKRSFDFLKLIRQKLPNVKIVVGGPHVTLLGRQILEVHSHIDFAFTGEAEATIVQLLEGKKYGEIPGLIYRDNGAILHKAPFIRQPDLDAIEWPRYEKFELKRYANELGIITSRGCPYSCIFCSVALTLGKKVRKRSAQNIGNELEYWYKRGRRIFNFLDDNLTFYREQMFTLCDEIERRNLKNLTLRASNGLRADSLDEELLKRMKEVGFKSFGIGVEAGNNRVLKILKKGETIEQIEDVIRLCCDMGFEISLFFVYGTPGETMEDIEDSVNIARKYPVFKTDFYNLIPFPGTQLWKFAEDNRAWTGKPMNLLNTIGKNLRFSRSTANSFFITKELGIEQRGMLAKRLRKVSLDIQKTGIKRLFAKYGILKHPIACICSSVFFQKVFFNNNALRKLSDRFRFVQ